MSKSPDAFRTISEVAEWLGVQAHVLRFWESKFTQVKPIKRAGGRRYYRPADMLLLGGIRKLLHDDGMSIKEVQAILRDLGISHVSEMSHSLDAAGPGEQAEGDGGGSGPSSGAPQQQAAQAESEQAAEDAGVSNSGAPEQTANAAFMQPTYSHNESDHGPLDADPSPADAAFSTDEEPAAEGQDDPSGAGQDFAEAQSEPLPTPDPVGAEPLEATPQEDPAPEAGFEDDALHPLDTGAPDAPVEAGLEAASDPAQAEASPESAEPEQFMMDLDSPGPMAPADAPAPSALPQDLEITAAPFEASAELDDAPLMDANQDDAAPAELDDVAPLSLDPQNEESAPLEPTPFEMAAVDAGSGDDLGQDLAATSLGADESDFDSPQLSEAPLSQEDEPAETADLTTELEPGLPPAEDLASDLPQEAFAPSFDAAADLAGEPALAASEDPVTDGAAEAKPRIITVADEDLAAQVSLRPGIFSILSQTTEIPPHVHSEVAACAAELRAWLESK
jgi:DNA-binding transcriptional MerR regulator